MIAGPAARMRGAASWSQRATPAPARVARGGAGHGLDTCQDEMTAPAVTGGFTGHDLLRAYAAELAAQDEDEAARDLARRRLSDHYLHTAAAAAHRLCAARPAVSLAAARPGTVPEQFASFGEALSWFSAEHQVLLAVTDAAAAADHGPHAWQLPAMLTDYLNREGHWHDLAALGRIALAAAERDGDRLGLAHAHASIGVANLRLGCYNTARTHLLRASTLFRESGATAWQARTRLTIGVLFDRRGRHDKARRQAEQALGLYQGLGYRAGEAHALMNLGLAPGEPWRCPGVGLLQPACAGPEPRDWRPDRRGLRLGQSRLCHAPGRRRRRGHRLLPARAQGAA
jgi:tetratricopeptide (TPR) repeat protein